MGPTTVRKHETQQRGSSGCALARGGAGGNTMKGSCTRQSTSSAIRFGVRSRRRASNTTQARPHSAKLRQALHTVRIASLGDLPGKCSTVGLGFDTRLEHVLQSEGFTLLLPIILSLLSRHSPPRICGKEVNGRARRKKQAYHRPTIKKMNLTSSSAHRRQQTRQQENARVESRVVHTSGAGTVISVPDLSAVGHYHLLVQPIHSNLPSEASCKCTLQQTF